MKKVEAIVRPTKFEALKEAFLKENVHGMTVSQVQGCGNQHGWKEYYRGSEILLNMQTKIKIEIIVADAQVDRVVELICETARTGEFGDGKIFIYPIDEIIRIRTGEKGEAAI